MYFTCDDIAIQYANQLGKLDQLKDQYPDFKVTCFVIAKGLDLKLIEWLKQDWIEVAVHGYDHDYPPECEREDKSERIKKALAILKPLLPDQFGFRPPGFQITGTTYPILRELGFWYIAHQTKIQPLKQVNNFNPDILINSHIYDNNIGIRKYGEFKFISEGFDYYASQV